MAGRRRGMTVLSYLITLLALCIAMAYIDALASFYVRGMIQAGHEGAEFATGAVQEMPQRIISLELTRQAAFVLVLLTVAIVAGRNGLQQAGSFIFCVGAWIVLRYIAIRALTDWPASLVELDAVIFLPEPLYAPIWMTLILGLALGATGVLLIRSGAARRRSS